MLKYCSFTFVLFCFSSLASVGVNFSPNGGVRQKLLSELKASQNTLYIAIYSLSDAATLKQLKELSTSGVKIRMVMDSAKKNEKKCLELEEAGIDVRYVSPVMHHKFAIIDGPHKKRDRAETSTLVTGSFNWSPSAESLFDEDFLVFKNETAMVLAFQNEFNFLWAKSTDFEGPAPALEASEEVTLQNAPVVFTSANVKAVARGDGWSFKPSVSDAINGIAGTTLVAAIEAAKSKIQIATAHFRRPDIYAALVTALERGVTVELVIDQQEINLDVPDELPSDDTTHLEETLSSLGAQVKYKTYSLYWDYRSAKQMHSKYMIVDENRVFTGSFNWSENAELNTFENLIQLKGSIVKEYTKNFAKIFTHGDFDELIEQINNASQKGPCTFNPVSMDLEQVRQFRASYKSGACRN